VHETETGEKLREETNDVATETDHLKIIDDIETATNRVSEMHKKAKDRRKWI
jgi:hypothetical protein